MKSFLRVAWTPAAVGFLACILMKLTAVNAASQQPNNGSVIKLPDKDRTVLAQLLGEGVVGKAVPAQTISNPLTFFPLRNGTWTYRMTSGKNKGATVDHVLSELKRDAPGTRWQEALGGNLALFLLKSENGSVENVSTHDQKQGVISRYSPREPFLIADMRPGASKRLTSAVKVYDLSHPDHLTHSGSLDITYSYVGAYEVTVPAGTFKASLFKWQYEGKVGPAKVQDIQYRFYAENVGTVAMIEKTDVSALLVYQQHTKIGKVLIKHP